MSDNFYRAFEDRYRGSRELIKSRLEVYLPFVRPLLKQYPKAQALDLGCGRGEWLELLCSAGYNALGVDLDAEMLSACTEICLNVKLQDALTALHEAENDSLCVVSAFHLVEHMPFDQVREIIAQAKRALVPGGLLILETPNPENIVVGACNFYFDPTHQRPIPLQLLAFAVEHAGFARTKTLRLQERPEIRQEDHRLSLMSVLADASPDYAIIGQKQASAEISDLCAEPFAGNYGLSLDVVANRYTHQLHQRITQVEEAVQIANDRATQAEAEARRANDRAAQAEAEARRANDSAPIKVCNWFKFQIQLIQQHGMKKRAKAFIKRVLSRSMVFADRYPGLRRRCVAIATRLGIKDRLRNFYFGAAGSDFGCGHGRGQGLDYPEDFDLLSKHGQRIYEQLSPNLQRRKGR